MDRRQQKTREAIFSAFIELAAKKSFGSITVSEIIDKANIGRATFYAHFETKDFLLKELCAELFDHVFEAAEGSGSAHNHIFDCDASDEIFLHLFKHLQKNDNNILKLLSCRENGVFMVYFRDSLIKLIEKRIELFEDKKSPAIPMDFFINHVASAFIETLRYWINGKMQLSPEKITSYFFAII
jgi:AcrR family transcriptional regulator